jgi:hypothetical protein
MELPCEDWPKLKFARAESPDRRLLKLLKPAAAQQAMAAMDAVLANLAAPHVQLLRDETPDDVQHQLMSSMSPADQEALNSAAFEAFASAASAAGLGRPDYEGHRRGLPELIAKVNAYGGGQLGVDFQIPVGATEDRSTVFIEFRHEQLILRPKPDPALFVDIRQCDQVAANDFVLNVASIRYLQLVAMPRSKACAMYQFPDGGPHLMQWPYSSVTALRRRWVAPSGQSRVEFLLVRAADLAGIIEAAPGLDILTVISLSVLGDAEWRNEWLTPGSGTIDRAAVLIDSDPFALLDRQAKHGHVTVSCIRARLDLSATDYTEIVCVTVEHEPGVLYFTPCTAAFRQAVIEYSRSHLPHATLESRVPEGWEAILLRLVGHSLKEEPRFGMDFW